jgi:hypothetical protein
LLGGSCRNGGTRSAGRTESVAFLVAKLPLDDRGDLSIVDTSTRRSQVVAANTGAFDLPTAVMTGEARIPVVVYGRNASSPPIELVDTVSGKITDVGSGHGPALGPDDQLAYCDADGRLVVATIGTTSEPIVVADLRAFTSCVPLAWQSDGELAFAARSPFGTHGSQPPLAMFIWHRGANLREFKLPADTKAANSLSWSQDASRLILISDNAAISIDAVTGEAAVTQWSGRPELAPVATAVVAVWSRGKGVEVYEDSQLRASYAVTGPIVGFAWNAAGDRLAISTGTQLVLWSWRTDSTTTLRTASSGELILPFLVWLAPS